MTKHTVERRIMWGDLDALGIVFYPRYYEWIDGCGHLFFESVGINMNRIAREQGLIFGLTETGCRYFKPGRYHDRLQIVTFIDELTPKTVGRRCRKTDLYGYFRCQRISGQRNARQYLPVAGPCVSKIASTNPYSQFPIGIAICMPPQPVECYGIYIVLTSQRSHNRWNQESSRLWSAILYLFSARPISHTLVANC